jgi:hypothetical protein
MRGRRTSPKDILVKRSQLDKKLRSWTPPTSLHPQSSKCNHPLQSESQIKIYKFSWTVHLLRSLLSPFHFHNQYTKCLPKIDLLLRSSHIQSLKQNTSTSSHLTLTYNRPLSTTPISLVKAKQGTRKLFQFIRIFCKPKPKKGPFTTLYRVWIPPTKGVANPNIVQVSHENPFRFSYSLSKLHLRHQEQRIRALPRNDSYYWITMDPYSRVDTKSVVILPVCRSCQATVTPSHRFASLRKRMQWRRTSSRYFNGGEALESIN